MARTRLAYSADKIESTASNGRSTGREHVFARVGRRSLDWLVSERAFRCRTDGRSQLTTDMSPEGMPAAADLADGWHELYKDPETGERLLGRVEKAFVEYRYEDEQGGDIPGFLLRGSNNGGSIMFGADGGSIPIPDGCWFCRSKGGTLNCKPVPCPVLEA